jgi:hypothetical protein
VSNKRPLKLRELLKRLKPYGIVTMAKRGKGSERILLQPESPGSKRGPQYPIKDHGQGTEIKLPVIDNILRRFHIDPSDFWKM